MALLENVRVVLVGPQEPMNVGAVARAMKNFGLSQLGLVMPEERVAQDLASRPNSNAYKLAVHAEDVLENLRVYQSLAEAVSGCVLVVGTTVRPRDLHTGPVVFPREAASQVVRFTQQGSVALVFGREMYGLSNEELDLSHLVVRIPTAPEQKSLNLAQAVLLCCYEIFLAADGPAPPPEEAVAGQDTLMGLFQDLEAYVLETGFTDENRHPYAKRRLRKILHKALLTPGEVQLLRGLLHQSRWYAAHKPK